MIPGHNADSADIIFKFKNIIWAFPYLAVMGLIWGYLADASSGALVGLAASVSINVLIGLATPIFNAMPAGDNVNTGSKPIRSTMEMRKKLASELNAVRYHKLCHQFDDALAKIEEVLAKNPDFVEALLLKAQILWEGFENSKAASGCLIKILAVAPDEKDVFHRWAMNMYRELHQE